MKAENRPTSDSASHSRDGQAFWLERPQPLVELDLRRAQIRRDAALAGVERDDRVGLVGPERQNAARPVIA